MQQSRTKSMILISVAFAMLYVLLYLKYVKTHHEICDTWDVQIPLAKQHITTNYMTQLCSQSIELHTDWIYNCVNSHRHQTILHCIDLFC